MQEWAADLIEWVVDAFAAGWHKIGQIVSSIIPSANAAEAQGARGPQAPNSGGASGHWAPSAGGATGRWGDPAAPIDLGTGDGWGSSSPSGLFAPSSGHATGASAGRRKRSRPAGIGPATLDPQELYHEQFLRSEKDAYDQLGDFEAEAAKRTAALDRAQIDLEREMLASSGKRHQAELLHLQAEIQAKTQLLVLNGRISQADADAFMAKAKAAMRYQQTYEKVSPIDDAAKRDEAKVAEQEKSGVISRSRAEDELFAIRQRQAEQLRELIPLLKAYADASGDPKLQKQVADLSAGADKAGAEKTPALADLQTGMLKATDAGFQQMFRGILSGSESSAKALEKFAQSIKGTFIDLVSKRLGDALFDSLFGSLLGGGSGASAGGGILGNLLGLSGSGSSGGGLLGLLGGLFGGGSGAAGLGGATDGASSSDLSAIFGAAGYGGAFASGTDYVPRDMLATIHKGERIMPASDNAAFTAAAALSGGSRSQQHQHYVQFDDSMRNTRVTDLLDAHIQREMATR
ncbi:MAG: hypothetical protein KGM91_27960 [Burkholderiales bacterium]|nr:hypothetical protein [Burkholderiales bacterium]